MLFLKKSDRQEILKVNKQIQDELDDHLTAINENSSEIAQNSDHLTDLEIKFEKLKERVDDIYYMLSRLSNQESYELSKNEKRVFMVLYAIEKTPLSFADIAVRTHMTELSVKAYIFSMINKGIPIVETKLDSQSYFKLDKSFKEKQAKENILRIEPELRVW